MSPNGTRTGGFVRGCSVTEPLFRGTYGPTSARPAAAVSLLSETRALETPRSRQTDRPDSVRDRVGLLGGLGHGGIVDGPPRMTDHTASSTTAVESRAKELLHQHDRRMFAQTGPLFMGLMLVQWVAVVAVTYWISPAHVLSAFYLGGALGLMPTLLAIFCRRRDMRVLAERTAAVRDTEERYRAIVD